jgi:hypothetical protein
MPAHAARSGDAQAEPTRPELAQYSNYFEVGQNPYEFLIDFGQFSSEANAVHFHTRVAMPPAFAKLLFETLESAIRKHETLHGEIPISLDQLDLPEFLLKSLPNFEERVRRAQRERTEGVESSHPSSIRRP